MKKTKKTQILPKPVRWYAPDQKAFDRLVALGATERAIYRGWKGELPGKFRMREGEVLGVVDGFRAFGTGKREIKKAIGSIHDCGAFVQDVETGQDSCRHGHLLFDAATSPRRHSAEYRRQMADEKAEARRVKAGGLSNREAQIVWQKASAMSADERAEYIRIPRSTLYKMFGKSGAPAGRRPKHLIEK
jgi:hypothetical protein